MICSVDELVAAGNAEPFSPAGRRFRERASIPQTNARSWKRLLAEALQFALDHPVPTTKRR